MLTMQWLAQLGFFLVFKVFGWWGFLALKGLLFVGMLLMLKARQHAQPLSYAILISTLLVVIFSRFPTERPHFFSFFAFALLLVLFERLIDGKLCKINRLAAALIPCLLLVWSNLHPLAIIGQIFCVFALVHYTWQYKQGCLDKALLKAVLLTFVVALACSFINPNGLHWFASFASFKNDEYRLFFETVPEYDSIWKSIVDRQVYVYLFFVVVFALAGVDFLKRGIGKNLPGFLLLLAFAVVSFDSVRYLPFLGILAISAAGNGLAGLGKPATNALVSVLFVAGILFTAQNFNNYKIIRDSGPISNYFPKQAVDFLKSQEVKGYALNYFAWGGYLMFILGEGTEVFVDGRTLYPDRYKDYATMGGLGGNSGDIETLRGMLNKYQFDYTILPKVYKGRTVWINQALAYLGNWRLLYDQDNIVIYVRQAS